MTTCHCLRRTMLFPQVKAAVTFLQTDWIFLAGKLVKSASQRVSNDMYSHAGEHTHRQLNRHVSGIQLHQVHIHAIWFMETRDKRAYTNSP